MSFRLIRDYARETLRCWREMPDPCRFGDVVLFWTRWRRSQIAGSNALDDASPWLTFGAIRFLERHLMPKMSVFEFGSGGSTLFFAGRVGKVVSVEHDEAWANRVREFITKWKHSNVQLLLVPPEPDSPAVQRDPSDTEAYFSSDENFRQHSFKRYAAAIDSFADGAFDLVVMDGRARPSCFKHARSKVTPGGWLMLDNAERGEYRRIHEAMALAGWKKLDFTGPGPYIAYFWKTCFWQRPR